MRRWSAGLVVLLLLLGRAAGAPAHEIPQRVAIVAFIKPAGDRLEVIVRVPLEAMRDMEFPLLASGDLDLERVAPLLPENARLWVGDYLDVYENGGRLTADADVRTRLALPSDRSFERHAIARASFDAPPLPPETGLRWQQALLDILITYPIASEASRFSIEPALAHLGVRTTSVLRFLPPGGSERIFQYEGNPGLVHLDPRWHQAAWSFVELGFTHILDGLDHLLFVFCLVIPVRRWRVLLAIVTAFTVAHSITLAASALGVAPDALWFPPLIETLIALSIVYMALENMIADPRRLERRWRMAFAFGLVHGFGFSFLLRDSLQYAGGHLVTSLAAFNVGVELGQVFVLALAVPALNAAFRRVLPERAGTIILSALVAHSAWHWMTERGGELLAYRITLPAFDATFVLGLVQGAMLLLVAVGVAWLLSGVLGRLARTGDAGAGVPRGEASLSPGP